MSDSQSSLQALSKPSTKSSIVLNTLEELNKANRTNNITILKVPAHTGLEGNETADKLAKLATSNSATYHKLRRSINSIINELKDKLFREHIARLGKDNISDKAKEPMIAILKNINIAVM